MIIRFRQSGGVAGVARVAEVDCGRIPEEEAGRLRTMVDRALAEAISEPRPALPDEEQYSVEIEIEHRRETILVARSSVPDPLRPLIEYLDRLAEYEKR